ncbi:MAG TPA: DUF4292 domain-containing protein [Flavobacteriales bacterium]
MHYLSESTLARPTKWMVFTFLVLVLNIIATSCGTKKQIIDNREPLRHRSAAYLLKQYEDNSFQYEWIGMKLDVEFKSAKESQGFKATVRMHKDSAIWMSISPLLGIEMIRVLVTPDTLKYLSKIPDNKFYYIGSTEQLNQKLGVDLDFDMLQDLLLGNAIGLEKDVTRFRSEIDGYEYMLISRYKRKVRRIVGVDDRKLDNDTIVINPNDPRYQRTIKRVDENEGIIVSRYWLEPDNFRLVKSVFNDVIRQRTMDIRYGKFQKNGEQLYPSHATLQVSDPKGTIQVNFDITRMVTDKTYEFPFEIPDDYARRDSL